jgi:hypothetical protein
MGAYPTTPRSEFLLWCTAHVEPFTSNAAQIGITPAMATAFSDAVDLATAKTASQQEAKQALRVATEQVGEAFEELRELTGELVRTIKAFAENSSKPSIVYNAAQIDPPAPPSPAPPPGMPTDLVVGLEPSGALSLRWKCQNPPGTQGTVYLIERRLNTTGPYLFRGAVGEKRFNDDTVPAGTSQVEYKIWAQRSDAQGVANFFTVRFGVGGGGGFAITQQFSAGGGEESAKLAA